MVGVCTLAGTCQGAVFPGLFASVGCLFLIPLPIYTIPVSSPESGGGDSIIRNRHWSHYSSVCILVGQGRREGPWNLYQQLCMV